MSKPDVSNHLTPSEKEALFYIIENGPTYAYYLGDKKAKVFKTEKTANTSLNNLAKKGLLEKKETKDQRDKKNYYLTLKGVFRFFDNSDVSDKIWEKMDIIIAHWGHLLPLLKKFYLFKEHGLEEEMRSFLIRASNIFANDIEMGLLRGSNDVTSYLIESSMHRADADFMLKWNKVLCEDKELRDKTKSHLLWDSESLRCRLTEIETRLCEIFPELESSNPDWNKIHETELNLQRAHITAI